MDGLEESIFQRNVVGKYSKWDREEKSDARNDDEDGHYAETEARALSVQEEDAELMQYAQQLSSADIPESVRQSILAERARKSSTGVKGVLADYKEHKALERAQAQADALYRQQVLTRMAGGCMQTPQEEEEEVPPSGKAYADEEEEEEEDLADLQDDDEDDAFMRDFRAKRLREMRDTGSLAQVKSVCPSFGTLREISSADFLSEVDEEDPRVIIAVHLYEPGLQVCVRMNEMLSHIAAATPHVKFLCMQGSSNEIEVDRVTLPIITLYRKGETVSTLVGIAAEFGTYFTQEDIEWLLRTAFQSALLA
ncbi:thioredoxin-like protein [Ochromonadaceae sp. CCMP2298]|nr:thioredoxin-like protein [Ochromonadaceae sp. CCMP2298]|mmetsp:Transcript_13999/g.31420  ORF Transcript_13999/g.31420 Transcript_13999/m.31420 type:complete len:309 (-) Transcript_13999:67-993(-)